MKIFIVLKGLEAGKEPGGIIYNVYSTMDGAFIGAEEFMLTITGVWTRDPDMGLHWTRKGDNEQVWVEEWKVQR